MGQLLSICYKSPDVTVNNVNPVSVNPFSPTLGFIALSGVTLGRSSDASHGGRSFYWAGNTTSIPRLILGFLRRNSQVAFLKTYIALAAIFLFMAWGAISGIHQAAMDATELQEVTIEIPKLPELTFQQLYCNTKFPGVTQAGPHLKCLRTDIWEWQF